MSFRRATDEETEKGPMKQSPVNGEIEPNNAQENGPLQKKSTQVATPSPRKGSELNENSTRAQHKVMTDTPADGGQENLQCTLQLQGEDHSTADREVPLNAEPEEEDPAPVQDKNPDGVSLTTEVVCHENSADPKTKSATEDIKPSSAHDNVDEECSTDTIKAVAKPSEELTQNNEALSVPNSQPSAAAGQAVSISAVSQETNKEALSW